MCFIVEGQEVVLRDGEKQKTSQGLVSVTSEVGVIHL